MMSRYIINDDIDRIVLVGGSSKGCWVKDAISKRFKEAYVADNVDTISSIDKLASFKDSSTQSKLLSIIGVIACINCSLVIVQSKLQGT